MKDLLEIKNQPGQEIGSCCFFGKIYNPGIPESKITSPTHKFPVVPTGQSHVLTPTGSLLKEKKKKNTNGH